MSPSYDDEFHFNPGIEGLDYRGALVLWEALRRSRRALKEILLSQDLASAGELYSEAAKMIATRTRLEEKKAKKTGAAP